MDDHTNSDPSAISINGIYKHSLGDFDLTIVLDGFIPTPSDMFAANAVEGEAKKLLQAHGVPSDMVNTPLSILLVQSADRTILFDTGMGDQEDLGPNYGRLISSLELIGIPSERVSDVVISHFHPDHVGALSFDGALGFPNAQVYFPQAEWDFLSGPPPGNDIAAAFFTLAKTKLKPALDSEQVQFYGDQDELIGGVQAVFTPGHSPGHHSFMLNSEGEHLLITVDVAVQHVTALQHPEWSFAVDAIPDQAIATRWHLLGRAADEQLQIFSNHFPFPEMGYIIRNGSGFRYLPQP